MTVFRYGDGFPSTLCLFSHSLFRCRRSSIVMKQYDEAEIRKGVKEECTKFSFPSFVIVWLKQKSEEIYKQPVQPSILQATDCAYDNCISLSLSLSLFTLTFSVVLHLSSALATMVFPLYHTFILLPNIVRPLTFTTKSLFFFSYVEEEDPR
jgi:hypothetical protein